jgi:hypothetical protein
MGSAIDARVRKRLSLIGNWAISVVLALLLVVSVALGVIGIANLSVPVYWGTFTQDRCVDSRYGCRNIGSWVSDDGSIRKEDIALDGALHPVTSVRACYRPTGLLNDSDNNIVHTEFWSTGAAWVPWLVVIAIAGTMIAPVSRLGLRRGRSTSVHPLDTQRG